MTVPQFPPGFPLLVHVGGTAQTLSVPHEVPLPQLFEQSKFPPQLSALVAEQVLATHVVFFKQHVLFVVLQLGLPPLQQFAPHTVPPDAQLHALLTHV